MTIDELKVDYRDLVKIGYMSAGNDIVNMLNECVKRIETGELKNDREELLEWLRK